MPNINPTKYSKDLADALRLRGLNVEEEHWDGHKHVDIFIPSASIYIEVDGLQHFTNPDRIEADFKRNYFSDWNNVNTIHIPNELIIEHLDSISNAIVEVVKNRDLNKLVDDVV